VLTRAAFLLGCCLLAASAQAAEQAAERTDCQAGIRAVADALANDPNLSEEGRRAVEQLLRDAAQARAAGDEVVCKEMLEDARELLGIDTPD
jgi:hypothetical protein